MKKLNAFMKRKDIEISAKRYGIDALGAMAQGLFCSLLIGTIINTLGTQLNIPYFNTVGGYATAMSGAAVAGCCAQMIGFAVMSYPENKVGGLISQGLGTSMLQMGNIVKNPRIWIPAILTSAITGPIATCIFKMEMNGAAVSSGMGTCGLVGQIGVYTGWINDMNAGLKTGITVLDWIGLILICFVLPAILCPIFTVILKKIGWIKEGDLKLAD